ncbi:Copper resistance protein (plasmid) [Rhizobium gallicum bv. gallicum R602sp]|uniref:Copper resistance protein n=1 Tax=Rhizobium gallicum bv. gallicum R602sp TaxID=1041138 RepID=A0A0B4XH87_9HYPH|nr:copper resistance protein CopC [Rhizobium gallicum]AJD46115.1 Copper resistance protein [Rhizobium gallicum bv. gallicum R602sp]
MAELRNRNVARSSIPLGAFLWLATLAILITLLEPVAAFAHASLVRSTPAQGAVIAAPPGAIVLEFNEAVAPLALTASTPDGSSRSFQAAADGTKIVVSDPNLEALGTYLFSFRVVSEDGHPVAGTIAFSMGAPSPSPSTVMEPKPAVLHWSIWMTRWLLYLCFSFAVGGAFFETCLKDTASSSSLSRNWAPVGLALLVGSAYLQGLDELGLPFVARPQLAPLVFAFHGGYGVSITFGVTAFCLAWRMRPRGDGRRWIGLMALLAAAAAFSSTGHASTAEPRWLARSAIFIHSGSSMFWVGSLPVLLKRCLGAHRKEEGALEVFSRLIPLPLTALIVSGAVVIGLQVPKLSSLWTSSYGLILTIKLLFVMTLLALACLNRFWLTAPAIRGDERARLKLRRSVSAEVVIVVAIFAAVAGWRFTEPPRAALASQPARLQAHLHSSSAMAQLEIAIQSAGTGSASISVIDQGQRVMAVKEVGLRLSNPEQGIEPLKFKAVPEADHSWMVNGIPFVRSGRWAVTVDILISDFKAVHLDGFITVPEIRR